MHFRQAILSLDSRNYQLLPERANSFDEIYADFQKEEREGGTRYSIFLHPKQDVTINALEIQFDLPLPPGTRMFANGYQSWSESRLVRVEEQMPRLRNIARRYVGLSGDEHIPREQDQLHSWTYTYFLVNGQHPTGNSLFLGSLSERTGFTLFLYDQPKGILTVRKDMAGLQLSHSFPALDFWVGQGSEQEVFDAWFRMMEIPAAVAPPAIGWTSWYSHFTHISEEIAMRNLESFAAYPGAYFQIDDGWQTQVGDWFSAKPSFPGGMSRMALKIKEKNLLPGIWLAPFVASSRSDLVRKNPDWLLKDARRRPLQVGRNPKWGGAYYALDFYNEAVREYLSGVFHVVLEKWGYELLKLDFLFAVCLAPPPGKTRGGVMWEAMEFLRRQVGDKKILACGVPLGSAFEQVDYCRIGGDVHVSWEHKLLAFLRHRERVSTLAALRSTLGRWQLDGRAFRSDPDVFILRTENQQLTPPQQNTLLTINVLLGGLLFTSDDVGQYSAEQQAELESALDWRGSKVRGVMELEEDVFRIELDQEGAAYSAFCNLSHRARSLPFGEKRNGRIEIQPFETIVLRASRQPS